MVKYAKIHDLSSELADKTYELLNELTNMIDTEEDESNRSNMMILRADIRHSYTVFNKTAKVFDL